MVNFNFNFQKLANSYKKSHKLGKNGNLKYFPTASPKSYWELGSQVPTQFPRLLWYHTVVMGCKFISISNPALVEVNLGWVDVVDWVVTISFIFCKNSFLHFGLDLLHITKRWCQGMIDGGHISILLGNFMAFSFNKNYFSVLRFCLAKLSKHQKLVTTPTITSTQPKLTSTEVGIDMKITLHTTTFTNYQTQIYQKEMS